MRDWTGKRYWLIGASEGLGAALAKHMADAGAQVILSARSADRLRDLADSLPGDPQAVPMDVADRDSVAVAAEQVGKIDGLVFLAGLYWPMAATDWNAEQAEQMADVNFTGLVRVLGAALPGMVARDHGHIVVVGSLAGFRGLPGSVGYGAAKAGCMSLAETLACDLRRTNVQVQLANPGFIRTRLTDKNDFRMPFLMEPDDAAKVIFDHMNTRRFQRSFPTVFSWVFRLARLLPEPVYRHLFA
ncbi:SDR family NAD(P)-dependent oxidoreductase [Chachezhania sediminis]|uniref:SDR family NAD(P)-dependent oxidoreductase n=1 Tax=Chachezhania sediminis TaxID=2599291 RepID=UPI00131ACF07|nr:SDR family NAD(P)-dependent oxidoreductase [Chachezhania sediminis]